MQKQKRILLFYTENQFIINLKIRKTAIIGKPQTDKCSDYDLASCFHYGKFEEKKN